jgi:hypothetical protein
MGPTIIPVFMLLVGAYTTMVGFRWISPSKPTADPREVDEWYRRYGLLMRILGPILLIVALGQLLINLEVI